MVHAMSSKPFRLQPEQLRPIAVGYGAVIATDRIMKDGARIGYCYREHPDSAVDSSWRFFAGDETQAYGDDPTHLAYYDLNTIANYDPDIVTIIESGVGEAFERDASGQWVAIKD